MGEVAAIITAGKLAEGKFLYSEVLTDDSMKFGVAKAALSPEAQARREDEKGLASRRREADRLYNAGVEAWQASDLAAAAARFHPWKTFFTASPLREKNWKR